MSQRAQEVVIHLLCEANAFLLERVADDVFDQAVQPALVRAFLANPANVMVVAVADAQVVGMASGIAYVHPDKPLSLFVNEVGVAGPYQRRGIGRQLVAAILGWGRNQGCHEAWVATETGNGPARALYRSTGGVEEDEEAVVYLYPLTPAPETPPPANSPN